MPTQLELRFAGLLGDVDLVIVELVLGLQHLVKPQQLRLLDTQVDSNE